MKLTFYEKRPKDKNIARIVLREGNESVVGVQGGKKVIYIGLGDGLRLNRRKLVSLARKVVVLAKGAKISCVALDFKDFVKNFEDAASELAEVLAVNFELANFEFVKYKSRPRDGWNFVKEIFVFGKIMPEIKNGFKKGQIVGGEVNACRILANTPGGEMTPKVLAEAAKTAFKNLPVKVSVLGCKEMGDLKMGGVLGVAKGAKEEPKFIIMEYMAGAKDKPVVLVGKGVTFDTGGLNIKTGEGMYEMHMDMSGAASVIHVIATAAKLKIAKNIIGLIPAVENMPSNESFRPGDLLRMMSGKTVEIINTDAEGRVILADALTYAKKYKPRLVVDVATLTGAALAALCQRASAIFSKDENLLKLFQELGEESGDYVWPLPLWDEYEDDGIKGTFADIANAHKTKYGGAILGAMFLWQFVKDSKAKSGENFPWVHIDMAPRMTSIDGDNLAKGAAGEPVRLLVKLLEKF